MKDFDPIRNGSLMIPRDVVVNELDRLEKLVALQDAYIQFLNKANEGPILLAWVHGWRCPQIDIDTGEDFRKQIEDLRNG